jgi:uncharacterized protein
MSFDLGEKLFREEIIVTALEFRYVAAVERWKDKCGKGPKPYTNEGCEAFIRNFKETLSKVAGFS